MCHGMAFVITMYSVVIYYNYGNILISINTIPVKMKGKHLCNLIAKTPRSFISRLENAAYSLTVVMQIDSCILHEILKSKAFSRS